MKRKKRGKRGQAAAPVKVTQKAVIHVGAGSASLLIVQESGREIEILESLSQPLPLSEDLFTSGSIAPTTTERCVAILHSFGVTLEEYGLSLGPKLPVVCTNIATEADNLEAFRTRLLVACDVDAKPLDEGDKTRLVYLCAERVLKAHPNLQKKNLLVAHVGPGNTRVLYFQDGRVTRYSSYRLGSHRLREDTHLHSTGTRQVREMIQGHIKGTVEQIGQEFAGENCDRLLCVGEEIQHAARHLCRKGSLASLSPGKVSDFLDELAERSATEIARSLEIDPATAGSMIAAVEGCAAIARRLKIKEIAVPLSSFLETNLQDLVGADFATKRFKNEVLQSAMNLGKKYKVDLRHAKHVEELSVQLFRQLADLHGLEAADELLLRVAALLHEVGSFVSRRSHHKHSLYLIHNSEIFGLNESETVMIALIARYHRHSVPTPEHYLFADLDHSRRVRVSKLAALLRVADALERGHSERFKKIGCRIEEGALVINVGRQFDLSVEELALEAKGDLFKLIFGLDVRLEANVGRAAE